VNPQSKNPFRSWMFIYVGLMAAYVMAGQPVEAQPPRQDVVAAPALDAAAPLLRQDI